MWIYFLIFAIILYIASKEWNGAPISTKQLLYILLALGVFVGLGDMMGGYDRYIYCDLFDEAANRIRRGQSVEDTTLMGYRSEFSYVYWNLFIAHITENRYIFILLTTVAIYTMVFLSLRDYTEDHAFAIILFMGLWMFFTFTYLRQVMASVTMWYGYRYIIKGKRWLFLPFWFVAYGFHNSGIVFLPFAFIPYKKYEQSLVIGVMAICLAVGATGLPSGLFEVYSDTFEETKRSVGYAQDHPGFRWEYLAEVIVFLWLVFRKYDMIDKNNRRHIFLLNCTFMFCAVLLLFIHSSNAGRLSWYFMGGLIAMITMLFSRDVLNRRWVLLLMFGLFFRIVTEWGMLLSPYKTFLTPGNQCQHMTDKFEYDFNYEKDKFYRKVIDIV